MILTPLKPRGPGADAPLDGERALIAGGYGGLGTANLLLPAACGASPPGCEPGITCPVRSSSSLAV
jgi:hypothetical protein